MGIKFKHGDEFSLYFITFTCYKWLPLFERTNAYDAVYKWFDILDQDNHKVLVFVVMPNHLHAILYFPEPGYNLNKVISNGKRFLAYEIINRLEENKLNAELDFLHGSVTKREAAKGQVHKVFEESFDAKGIYNEKFFTQKVNYIHHNPVKGKWKLVNDYTNYAHSSASFYEVAAIKRYKPYDYRFI
jgi:REP element-mobilizing transposase RayT